MSLPILMWLLQPHYRKLLDTANRLASEGQYEAAVVVAHMACEVYTEQLVTGLFKAKGLDFLEDPISEFVSSYNLSNKRIRTLYTALSGDPVQNQPFWLRFVELGELRNAAVHRGARLRKEDVLLGCSAAGEFLSHLESVDRTLAPATPVKEE